MPMPVRILTPDGVVFETDDASVVTAPGEAGDLAVEPGHSNLMTTLRIGPLSVRTPDGADHLLAVHGGFLEATPQRVVIVADAAEKPEDIDPTRAEAARRRAERRLRLKREDIDMARAEAALKRAFLRLDVAGEHAAG